MVGISKAGSEGFELADLMEFVGKTYNNSNADVRSCAVKVTREVHDLVGPAIRWVGRSGYSQSHRLLLTHMADFCDL